MSRVDDCRLIAMPSRTDPRGSLCFMETGTHVPFEIRRLFTLYDLPADAVRGGHAHKDCHQLLFAMSGGFHVRLDDGRARREFTLKSPAEGLHVPPGIWVDLQSGAAGSVLAVLASHVYDEADYLRGYPGFLAHKGVSTAS